MEQGTAIRRQSGCESPNEVTGRSEGNSQRVISFWLCSTSVCIAEWGHPSQHFRAQAPSASLMMVLMVRAHRPHSALHPRHP